MTLELKPRMGKFFLLYANIAAKRNTVISCKRIRSRNIKRSVLKSCFSWKLVTYHIVHWGITPTPQKHHHSLFLPSPPTPYICKLSKPPSPLPPPPRFRQSLPVYWCFGNSHKIWFFSKPPMILEIFILNNPISLFKNNSILSWNFQFKFLVMTEKHL